MDKKHLLCSMFSRSWSPRQWYDEGERPDLTGETTMWVYQRIGLMWAVGFYDPDRAWHEDAQFNMKEEAAARVHWLNGGQK